MKIVLVGGGKVGYAIVRQLIREGHDIVVIDNSRSVVEEVSNSLDVMAVCGNGANLDVLKTANAGNADLLIACTAQDELNVLCCIFARKLGCGNTIARVRCQEYAEQMYYIKDELGLSMKLVKSEILPIYLKKGLPIHMYCADNDSDVKLCIEKGAALITANDPIPLLNAIK